MTQYGNINLDQHWLRQWLVAWWHQTITWTNVGEVLWHSPESNFSETAQATILYYAFEKFTFEITATSPRDQWVSQCWPTSVIPYDIAGLGRGVQDLTSNFAKVYVKFSTTWEILKNYCLPYDLNYRQVSNIRRTLVGNKIVDHSGVVGASPVGAAPTTSSFST